MINLLYLNFVHYYLFVCGYIQGEVGRVAQSVHQLATGWTVRGSNPGGGETGPGAHLASCTIGTGSFPGVESGRGVTLTPPPPSAEV
jgi:hypothetical protein